MSSPWMRRHQHPLRLHLRRRFLFWVSARLRVRQIDSHPGRRYLERYRVAKIFGISIYLHRFVSGAGDQASHDHPWAWAFSLVLVGSYLEQLCRVRDMVQRGSTEPEYYRTRGVFQGNWLGPDRFHRIDRTDPETWTLMVTGPSSKVWGFLTLDPVGRFEQLLRFRAVTTPPSPWSEAPRGDEIDRAPLVLP